MIRDKVYLINSTVWRQTGRYDLIYLVYSNIYLCMPYMQYIEVVLYI